MNKYLDNLVLVILAGGSGSRLWPLSREHYPKQLITLVGQQSLLQATVTRLKPLLKKKSLIVVCNEEYRFLIAEQLRELDVKAKLILEPEGKDTAAAIALAANFALNENPNSLILALPADHLIEESSAFLETIEQGLAYALDGKIVTLGVTPSSAHTGFGYIKALGTALVPGPIEKFVEKPSLEIAEGYLKEGGYYWNSGIFLFAAQIYLSELSKYAPDIAAYSLQSMNTAKQDADFIRPDPVYFAKIPKKSIDYALMEHTTKGYVIPLRAAWTDLGSWVAVAEQEQADKSGNVLLGNVYTQDVYNSYLRAESRVLTVLGLENVIAVETADAVLISHKSAVDSIKILLKALEQDDRKEVKTHVCVHRPWGFFQILSAGLGYQVRQVTLHPQAELTKQRHAKRAEHWIILQGQAEVLQDETWVSLASQESIFIPANMLHQLRNSGKIPLVLLEVQTGTELSEDDIERE